MRNAISVILGGGKGTRLYPLTAYRSKPAVPLAGKYRLIDVPISNSINSEINRIYLLTQYNSVSLHRHIRQTYLFDRYEGGFVEILAAQQTFSDQHWYQGTADAVRQNMRYFQQPGIDHVLILSGDQLYRMDYREMFRTHEKSGADVTIAAVPVTSDKASAFGIIQFDDSGRVVGFREKPKSEAELETVRTDPKWLEAHGIRAEGRDCLANMGIYLFNREVLSDLLGGANHQDFGKEVFPASIASRKVQVHLFDGYWEDIGTIKAFYDANLALVRPNPPFRLFSNEAPIYTRARYLPPALIEGASITSSFVADGCMIQKGTVIENSIIGLRCQIGERAVIRNSILMGSDYYVLPDVEPPPGEYLPKVSVGAGSQIEGAIIDKNCRLGCNVRIVPQAGAMHDEERDGVVIRDGIIVVPKETMLFDGWSL